MGVFSAWFVLVSWLTYQRGVKQGKLPEPSYYVGATAAMSIVALIAEANSTIGNVLAWGLVIGAFVSGQFKPAPAPKQAVSTDAAGNPLIITNNPTAGHSTLTDDELAKFLAGG